MIDKQAKFGEWIPCSERLPEMDIDVLVCFWSKLCENVKCPKKIIKIAHLKDRHGFSLMFVGSGINHEIKDVLAWQPLPEPYSPK